MNQRSVTFTPRQNTYLSLSLSLSLSLFQPEAARARPAPQQVWGIVRTGKRQTLSTLHLEPHTANRKPEHASTYFQTKKIITQNAYDLNPDKPQIRFCQFTQPPNNSQPQTLTRITSILSFSGPLANLDSAHPKPQTIIPQPKFSIPNAGSQASRTETSTSGRAAR